MWDEAATDEFGVDIVSVGQVVGDFDEGRFDLDADGVEAKLRGEARDNADAAAPLEEAAAGGEVGCVNCLEAAVGDFEVTRHEGRHRGTGFVFEFFDARFGVGDECGDRGWNWIVREYEIDINQATGA
jgi:hypothetical protein